LTGPVYDRCAHPEGEACPQEAKTNEVKMKPNFKSIWSWLGIVAVAIVFKSVVTHINF
jgi:hypothetical protein